MNEVQARALLERAIAQSGRPALTVADVDLLMATAADVTTGLPVFTAAGLNAAAALGWTWKAGLTADRYDMGGGGGKSLTQSQWFAQCSAMAERYRSGALTVDGTGGRTGRSGLGSVGLRGALGELG